MDMKLTQIILVSATSALALSGCAGVRHWTIVDAEAEFSSPMQSDQEWTISQLDQDFANYWASHDDLSIFRAQQKFEEWVNP